MKRNRKKSNTASYSTAHIVFENDEFDSFPVNYAMMPRQGESIAVDTPDGFAAHCTVDRVHWLGKTESDYHKTLAWLHVTARSIGNCRY